MVVADVLVHPLGGAQVDIAVTIHAAHGVGAGDVKDAGMMLGNPLAGAVLVVDRVDTEPGFELLHGSGRARLIDLPQRLREFAGAAPDADPQRSPVGAIGSGDD